MSWEKSSYTKAGAALLSESLSGGALTITRAASGTGSVDTDLSAETAVSGDTHELSLLGIETVTDDGKTARKVSIQVDEVGQGRDREAQRRRQCPCDYHHGSGQRSREEPV